MQERSFKKQAKVTILVSYLKIVCKCYCACTYACKYYNFWADLQFIAWKKLTHKCYWHLLNFLHRDKEVLISPLTERSSSLNQPHWFYAEIPQASRILSRHQPDLLHCIPKALSNWWLLLSFWKNSKICSWRLLWFMWAALSNPCLIPDEKLLFPRYVPYITLCLGAICCWWRGCPVDTSTFPL